MSQLYSAAASIVDDRVALTELTEFIDYYNTSRPHSSLGYLSPSQLETTVPC